MNRFGFRFDFNSFFYDFPSSNYSSEGKSSFFVGRKEDKMLADGLIHRTKEMNETKRSVNGEQHGDAIMGWHKTKNAFNLKQSEEWNDLFSKNEMPYKQRQKKLFWNDFRLHFFLTNCNQRCPLWLVYEMNKRRMTAIFIFEMF